MFTNAMFRNLPSNLAIRRARYRFYICYEDEELVSDVRTRTSINEPAVMIFMTL